MSIARKILMGAAGGKKDSTYVDDVFSTYLYKGDEQSGRAISNGIKLSNNNAGNGVTFDGNGDYLTTSSSSDYAMGTGDYTVECWVKINSGSNNYGIFQGGGLNTSYLTGPTLFYYVGSGLTFGNGAEQGSNTHPTLNQWFHVALVKNGSNTTLYYNGSAVKTVSDSHNYTNQSFALGGYYSTSYLGAISISNFRVVKGTAVYTSSFTVPTEPLTNVTNTKLLCCQGSTLTAATVINGTITVNGNPNISSGPFTMDDGEGGMVWIKSRGTSDLQRNVVFDTERGAGKAIFTNSSLAEQAVDTSRLSSFNNNGFTIGNAGDTNLLNTPTASWTFRKAPGFFDVVTYTGNDANRAIAHSLGCVPGLILIKGLSAGHHWQVYHRTVGNTKVLKLNDYDLESTTGTAWNNTSPTATHINLGVEGGLNQNGQEYVAYIFAGGSATTQYSVKTNAGNANYLSVPTHSDLDLDGDFTVEFWHKRNLYPATTGTTQLFGYGNAATNAGIDWYYNGSNVQKIYINATEYEFPNGTQVGTDTWAHYAISREGTNTRVFINGELMTTYTSHSSTITGAIVTGTQWGGTVSAADSGYWSNLRVVKGTALYTATFTPPQSALTNITNTKLLCWNSSTTTGATVSPVTIVQHGTVTSTRSIPSLSDPKGFEFGKGGDQNLIACGGYIGNSSGTWGPTIDLGWEPQWVLIKRVTGGNPGSTSYWMVFDSMRGIVSGGNDCFLNPNTSDGDNCSNDWIKVTSRGFKVDKSDQHVNEGGNEYVYVAIRRPDGLVGKPVEVGTDVFAMDTGSSSSTIPTYDSGFPVDFALYRAVASASDWWVNARLTQGQEFKTNSTAAESAFSNGTFDSNVGWAKNSGNTQYSWMWKRGAGFDVVCYTGNGVSPRIIRHNLGIPPEMIWTKGRNSTYDWKVWHMGLTGGSNGATRNLSLNTTDAQSTNGDIFGGPNSVLPTSEFFTTGGNAQINQSGTNQIAMLFASIKGISKCGSYDGTDTTQTITTGFQPRFLIIKRFSAAGNWIVLDTTRGWASGNDQRLKLESTAAQESGADVGDPTSTGFTLTGNQGDWNDAGSSYIYYAHA